MTDNDKKTITVRLKDGTEATFKVREDSHRTLGEVIEAMTKENREMIQELIANQPGAPTADDRPTPDNLPVTPHTASNASGVAACPWCGHPIALSQTTAEEW